MLFGAAPLPLRGVHRGPLLVAAVGVGRCLPAGEVVERAVDLGPVARVRVQRRVVDGAVGRRGKHRVGAEDAGAEHALRLPTAAAVERHVDAGLPEVAGDRIELPPADGNSPAVEPRHRERRLIGGIPDDVVAAGVDIHLHAHEAAEDRALGGRYGGRHFRIRDRRHAGLLQRLALLRGHWRGHEQRSGDRRDPERCSPLPRAPASKPEARSHVPTIASLARAPGLAPQSNFRHDPPRPCRSDPATTWGPTRSSRR